MAVKNEKDVAMEGQDWTSRVARHQAYMNKLNATVKSQQQTCNYYAALGLKYKNRWISAMAELAVLQAELKREQAEHFVLLEKAEEA